MNKILRTATILTLSIMVSISHASASYTGLDNVIKGDIKINIYDNFTVLQLKEVKKNTQNVFRYLYQLIDYTKKIFYKKAEVKGNINAEQKKQLEDSIKDLTNNQIELQKELDTALDQKFDINARNNGEVSQIISDIICEFIQPVSCINDINFLDIGIIDKVLEKTSELSLYKNSIDKIVGEIFCFLDIYIDKIKNNDLNDLIYKNHANKILNCLKKLIENSNNFYSLRLYYVYFKYNRDKLDELMTSINEELEVISEKKEKKFFNDLVQHINNYDLNGIKKLLSRLDNETTSLYYSDNTISFFSRSLSSLNNLVKNLDGIRLNDIKKLLNDKIKNLDNLNLDAIKKLLTLFNNGMLQLDSIQKILNFISIELENFNLNLDSIRELLPLLNDGMKNLDSLNLDSIRELLALLNDEVKNLDNLNLDSIRLDRTRELLTLLNDKVTNLTNFELDSIKKFLTLFNNEIIELKKQKFERHFPDFISRITCNDAMLIQLISYLKHNAMELAIGEELKKKILDLYCEKIKDIPTNKRHHDLDGITYILENGDVYKLNNKKYDNLVELIFKNGSMDEFLYFLTAKNHSLSLKFIMANPEHNPINMALEVGNIGIANYFIRDSESLYNADELIALSHLHKNANAAKEEILSLDMKAVNFYSLFADSIENKNFDIAYTILDSFSAGIDSYSNLSKNTKNALMSIYTDVLIQIINQDRRNNFLPYIATISQTHNITKDQFDDINPLLESALDYNVSYDERNISNNEREVLSNNDAYIFPNSIKTIGNPYSSKIMMLLEDIEDKLFH